MLGDGVLLSLPLFHSGLGSCGGAFELLFWGEWGLLSGGFLAAGGILGSQFAFQVADGAFHGYFSFGRMSFARPCLWEPE